MYADDTTLYFNLEDFPEQNKCIFINNELGKVNTWLNLNKLTLNVEKTKCMLFHKRRKVIPLQLKIHNEFIDIVTQFCFLGIMLDDTLSWKKHENMITNKLSKITGILNRLKYTFPMQILLIIYKSLFLPHVNYGSLVWGSLSERTGMIQKKAIRIITHSNFIAHTEPLLKELHLLKVTDMFSLKIVMFLHKLSHNVLPQYFEIYRPHLEKITTSYNLRQHPLPLPPVSHVYAESGLVYQLVKMKNNITVNDKLILQKIIEKSHSQAGFSKYVTNTMLDKYSYVCNKIQCFTCGRL